MKSIKKINQDLQVELESSDSNWYFNKYMAYKEAYEKLLECIEGNTNKESAA